MCKNTYSRGWDLSILCLKHSEYCCRKRDWKRRSHRGGERLCWGNSLLHLETCAQPPLEMGCHCLHWKKCAKILIYLRNIYQVNYKRRLICPPPSVLNRDWALSLHLFLSSHLLSSFSFCFLCLATTALGHPHGSTNMGSRDWWYSLFSSLALPGKIAKTWLLYSIS